VLWFPGPASATGEDCTELHLHGSQAVVNDVLDGLAQLPGFRLAEPGEFTLRAFESGKIDLTAAEGLSDLIAAQTALQRRQALRQASGLFREQLDDWRHQLMQARAYIEAELDFADEDDVPGSVADQVWNRVAELRNEIAGHLAKAKHGERIRSGVEIVILGPPNAGKSSLLNTLAQRDVAIVTSEAGTTRDVLEVSLDLNGAPVTLIDTAGLRETESGIEVEGIRRARMRAEGADLLLWLQDGSIDETECKALRIKELSELDSDAELWIIETKSDLNPTDQSHSKRFCRHILSILSGDGLDQFLADLTQKAHELCGVGEQALIGRARHRLCLERTLVCLDAGIGNSEEPIEFRSEHLRAASDELGRVTGRIDVEDLLGVIFSEFCIGK